MGGTKGTAPEFVRSMCCSVRGCIRHSVRSGRNVAEGLSNNLQSISGRNAYKGRGSIPAYVGVSL
ncbi:hypothetical protein D3C84_880450 [compost metagenome]